MELTSKIILHLYGEQNDPEELARLLQDEEVRLEYEALGEVKDLLDTQPAVRPRTDVIDAIVMEAARRHPGTRHSDGESAVVEAARVTTTSRTREDRPARVRQRRSFPAFAGALAALAVLFGLAWWHFSADGPLLPDALSPYDVATSEMHVDGLDNEGMIASQGEELGASEIPAWDESDALQRLRRQMQFIQARSAEDAWDEPVIPLEMRDAGAATPTLTSAQR